MANRVDDRTVSSRRVPPGTRAIGLTSDGSPIYPGNLAITRETAGTGGIYVASIRGGSGGPASNGTIAVEMSGELRPPIPRKDAPNYNSLGPTIKSLGPEVNGPPTGLSTAGYEKAHLWGPGFGDEARDGIMLAPREVNQVFQNQKMEEALRTLQDRVGDDGKVLLTARATSHPTNTTPPLNEPVLAHVEYVFSIQKSGEEAKELATVHIDVDKPPVDNPATQIQIDAKAADPNSDDAAVLMDALMPHTNLYGSGS